MLKIIILYIHFRSDFSKISLIQSSYVMSRKNTDFLSATKYLIMKLQKISSLPANLTELETTLFSL